MDNDALSEMIYRNTKMVRFHGYVKWPEHRWLIAVGYLPIVRSILILPSLLVFGDHCFVNNHKYLYMHITHIMYVYVYIYMLYICVIYVRSHVCIASFAYSISNIPNSRLSTRAEKQTKSSLLHIISPFFNPQISKWATTKMGGKSW